MTYAIGFIGGLFFAAAFPAPSAIVRDKVVAAVGWVRAKIGL